MCGEKSGINCHKVLSIRITPACAGKSSLLPIASGFVWDHPRMCGEKDHTYQQGLERMGSPPHVRGKAASICFSK